MFLCARKIYIQISKNYFQGTYRLIDNWMPGKNIPWVPFASIGHLVFGKTAEKVRKCIRAQGLSAKTENDENERFLTFLNAF
jgi:hypothetical protein